MKVFMSWSGETSKALAGVLSQWLPSVIQAAKPYYSPDDIVKGSRWNVDIAQELDASSIGLLCMTRENLSAPWIMFEAGALSKSLGQSKVCPILFGLEPSDIQGPLVQFQAARFGEAEMKRVVTMINRECGDLALETGVLDDVFEMWWPRLAKAVEKELDKSSRSSSAPIRSERELLEEILETTRTLTKVPSRMMFPSAVIEDLVDVYLDIVQYAMRGGNAELMSLVFALNGPLGYLVTQGPEGLSSRTRGFLRRLSEMSPVTRAAPCLAGANSGGLPAPGSE